MSHIVLYDTRAARAPVGGRDLGGGSSAAAVFVCRYPREWLFPSYTTFEYIMAPAAVSALSDEWKKMYKIVEQFYNRPDAEPFRQPVPWKEMGEYIICCVWMHIPSLESLFGLLTFLHMYVHT